MGFTTRFSIDIGRCQILTHAYLNHSLAKIHWNHTDWTSIVYQRRFWVTICWSVPRLFIIILQPISHCDVSFFLPWSRVLVSRSQTVRVPLVCWRKTLASERCSRQRAVCGHTHSQQHQRNTQCFPLLMGGGDHRIWAEMPSCSHAESVLIHLTKTRKNHLEPCCRASFYI